eukprot:6205331-Pleurochrysis_carterae.AAC.3
MASVRDAHRAEARAPLPQNCRGTCAACAQTIGLSHRTFGSQAESLAGSQREGVYFGLGCRERMAGCVLRSQCQLLRPLSAQPMPVHF